MLSNTQVRGKKGDREKIEMAVSLLRKGAISTAIKALESKWRARRPIESQYFAVNGGQAPGAGPTNRAEHVHVRAGGGGKLKGQEDTGNIKQRGSGRIVDVEKQPHQDVDGSVCT